MKVLKTCPRYLNVRPWVRARRHRPTQWIRPRANGWIQVAITLSQREWVLGRIVRPGLDDPYYDWAFVAADCVARPPVRAGFYDQLIIKGKRMQLFRRYLPTRNAALGLALGRRFSRPRHWLSPSSPIRTGGHTSVAATVVRTSSNAVSPNPDLLSVSVTWTAGARLYPRRTKAGRRVGRAQHPVGIRRWWRR